MNRINPFFACFCASFFSTPLMAAEPLKLCVSNHLLSALGYIARDQDYFHGQGLTVDFIEATSGKTCQDFLLAGKADAAITGEAPISYLSFNQHDLLILAQLGLDPEDAVFARADHGIRNPEDLKGKLIGYLPGSSSSLYTARWLDHFGWRKEDIHLTPLQPPALTQALIGGAVDAIIIWEPWGDNARQALGAKVVRFYDPSIYTPMSVLLARKAYTDKNPEATKNMLKALLCAETYINSHPDESQRALAQAVKYDLAIVKREWRNFNFQVKLGNNLVHSMDENAKYIIRDDRNFTGASVPNYRQYINPDFLRAADPERVEKGF